MFQITQVLFKLYPRKPFSLWNKLRRTGSGGLEACLPFPGMVRWCRTLQQLLWSRWGTQQPHPQACCSPLGSAEQASSWANTKSHSALMSDILHVGMSGFPGSSFPLSALGVPLLQGKKAPTNNRTSTQTESVSPRPRHQFCHVRGCFKDIRDLRR